MKKPVIKNKKGQDLSIGTLILIVLGIVVLVLLILGFTMGWENLWDRINIFGGGGGGIADVVTACRLAVTSNEQYTLCQRTWDIEVDGEAERVGCRDKRVLASLGASESEFGCGDIIYEDTIASGCIPNPTECEIPNPTDTDCIDACKFTEAVKDGDVVTTPASCVPANDAKETCSKENNKEECNALIGCKFVNPPK